MSGCVCVRACVCARMRACVLCVCVCACVCVVCMLCGPCFTCRISWRPDDGVVGERVVGGLSQEETVGGGIVLWGTSLSSAVWAIGATNRPRQLHFLIIANSSFFSPLEIQLPNCPFHRTREPRIALDFKKGKNESDTMKKRPS